MKKLFIFSSWMILVSVTGWAQISLSSADFPIPGDSTNVTEYTIPQTQSYPDSTSANDSLSIDRTLQKALQVINDTYMDDIETSINQTDTIPLIIYAQLPGMNSFHRVYGTPNSFLPGYSSFSAATTYTYMTTADGPAYVYYQTDATGFYELGSYLMPSGNPAITMINSPRKPIATFPVETTTPANVSGFVCTSSGGGISTVSHLDVTVDSYGSLVLVTGSVSSPVFTTYPDYIRTVQSSRDTMDLSSGMFYYVESKIYNYYVAAQSDPVVVYSVAKIRSNLDPLYWSMAGQWEDEIEVQWNRTFDQTAVAEKEFNLNLFPNPSDGHVSVALDAFAGQSALVTVYDVSGRCISTSRYEDGNVSLDLSDQPAGMYNLKIEVAGKTICSKLMIAY